MPTYDYVCEACGHKFEEFQSIKANPLKKCPSCGKLKLNRLIGTGSAVIFKGSGFYATDYRSDNYTKSAKSESSSSSTSNTKEAKTDTGKESKPETKSESKAEPKTETKSESKESKPTPPPSKPNKKNA